MHQSDEAGSDSKTLKDALTTALRLYLRSEPTDAPSKFQFCRESSNRKHINYYFKIEKTDIKIKLSKDYPMIDDRVYFAKTASDEETNQASRLLLEDINAASKPSAGFRTCDSAQLAGDARARDSSARSD